MLAIELNSIRKVYENTIALDGASLQIEEGEVHALIGENGAGKTTAVKILSGLVQPDSGSIAISGSLTRLANPQESHRHGIQTVYQEISLIPYLTVVQNMLLPEEPVNALGLVNRKMAARMVDERLDALGIRNVDIHAEVQTLDISTQQKLEIAKAVSRHPRILLLDEPSSALSQKDVEWLGGQIEKLRDEAVTVIYITHLFREVHMFCDALTILRNGKNVGSFKENEISDEEVIRLVVGRSLSTVFPPKEPFRKEPGAKPVLAGRDLTCAGSFGGVSFDIWPGEVLGLAALQGMGQNALFHALFGDTPLDDGYIERDSAPIELRSPSDAIRAGIGLIPHERKSQGLLLGRPGRENVTLPAISRFASAGLINEQFESIVVDEVLSRVNIHPKAMYTHAVSLSGGNQQKLVIAKWLCTGSQVLLMLDPTRGIDVGTKYEVYKLIREFVKERRRAIFIYSSEIPELIGFCDRVLVMYQGSFNAELSGDALTEENIMSAMLGVRRSENGLGSSST